MQTPLLRFEATKASNGSLREVVRQHFSHFFSIWSSSLSYWILFIIYTELYGAFPFPIIFHGRTPIFHFLTPVKEQPWSHLKKNIFLLGILLWDQYYFPVILLWEHFPIFPLILLYGTPTGGSTPPALRSVSGIASSAGRSARWSTCSVQWMAYRSGERDGC